MVTGVETAGLILAILPLLVNQIDGYARGLEKIRSLRRYRRELMRYSTGLSAQHVILLNTLELSLEGVVDNHDERWELINNPRGAGWASTQFQEKLRGKLGRNYDVFVSITKQLSDMLEELSEKLDLDEADKLNNLERTVASAQHAKYPRWRTQKMEKGLGKVPSCQETRESTIQCGYTGPLPAICL
ncbi:hypothetical protein Plec18170_006910 [Paecilomyces lecythidis]